MLTCKGCQDQLLEYVYGLLDVEASAVRAHLETCATCQAVHQKVLQQQKLIGEASKVPSTITFTAPKVEPVAAKPSDTPQSSSSMRWYATVAAVLLVVLAGNACVYWWGYETRWKPMEVAQNQLQQLQADHESFAAAGRELAELPEQIQKQGEVLATLEAERSLKYAAALAKAKSEAEYIQVVAPTSVESGRPLNYLVVN